MSFALQHPGNLGSLMGDVVIMAYFHPKQASDAPGLASDDFRGPGGENVDIFTPQ